MKWERIKDMCRYVVLKFRENVERKKRERQSVVLNSSNLNANSKKEIVDLSPKTSVPASHRRVSKRPDLDMITDTPEERSIMEEERRDSECSEKHIEKKQPLSEGNALIQKKSKTESEIFLQRNSQNLIQSESYKSSVNGYKRFECETQQKTETPEEEHQIQDYIPAPKYRVKTKVIQVRKDKSSTPLTKAILEEHEEQSELAKRELFNIPAKEVHSNLNSSESNQLTTQLDTPESNHDEHVRTRRRGIIQAPNFVKTFSDHDISDQKELISNSEDPKQNMTVYEEANRKYKEERESLVSILKKRRKAKSKRDLKALNEESFVKYERTKSGFLKAFPGKREVFTPPSYKGLYNRQKLLKQERDAILQQRLKLRKFYESVVELRDRVVVHETPVEEIIQANEKGLPVLEDTVSQMSNSIFNTVQSEQPEPEGEEANRYVRVYDKDLKEQESYRHGRRMSSWNM